MAFVLALACDARGCQMLKQRRDTPDIGALIHYPACWDTAAHPTLEHALQEILNGSFKCSRRHRRKK